MELHQIKKLLHSKENYQRVTPYKIISVIYKELIQLNIKKQATWFLKIDIFPNKTHRWHVMLGSTSQIITMVRPVPLSTYKDAI